MRDARLLLGVCALFLAPAAFAGEFIEDCGLEEETLPVPPVPPKRFETPLRPGEPPVVRREWPRMMKASGVPSARLRDGILKGKTVYISAGHGFVWTDASDAWRTQRGNTHDIVEDLVSIETVNQILLPMLLNAGAFVVPVREPDNNPNMVVVDNADEGYVEKGPAGLFSTSAITSWATPATPMAGNVLPFDLGQNRLLNTSPTATASAVWTPNVPQDGLYHVYISYSSYSARATDAHYVVHHAGGDAHFRVNQRRHGQTWVLLGRFYFRKGENAERGSVELLNDSQSGGNVSLDAVRFGGGMGNIFRGPQNELSGRPRFEESCRYHAQFSGAPTTVFQASSSDRTTDVSCRSRYAAWENESGEDSIYVAWHTNAVNGTVMGTESYVYGSENNYTFDYEPCIANTTTCASPPCANGCGAPGSDELARAIHNELVSDIRAGLNVPTWRDRGVRAANFGEINPSYNPEMPSALIEVAYHDNASDAAFLKEPRFRYVAARAFVQGMIRYFAQKDGIPVVFPPEPPSAIVARSESDSRVVVEWLPVASDAVGGSPADGYRVYQSADGLVWDEGADVATTRYEVTAPTGSLRYFRVTALNSAGESFPSQLLGVLSGTATQQTLIVNGFERLDASLAHNEDLSAYSLGSPLRVFIERMNDGTYLTRHAEAVAWSQVPFDSATAEAVTAGLALPGQYRLVDWFSGRDTQLSTESRNALKLHSESGRHILLSGAHLAGALASGSSEERNFLAQILRADFASSTSVRRVEWDSTSFLAGLAPMALDDGTRGIYNTAENDALALTGGVTVSRYEGTSLIAATAFDGPSKVVLLGFPFETVTEKPARLDLMGRILKHSGLTDVEPPPFDGGTPDPDPEPTPPIEVAAVFSSYPAVSGCQCGHAGGFDVALGLLFVGLLAWRRR